MAREARDPEHLAALERERHARHLLAGHADLEVAHLELGRFAAVARGLRVAHPRGRPPHHELRELPDRGLRGVEAAHHLAVAQHGDVVGDRQHLVEPVGDEQDAEPVAGQRPHDLEQRARLALGEHRGGLVEDQEPRVPLVDLARDLDELHVTDREPRHRNPLVHPEADAVERRARVAPHRGEVEGLELRPGQARQPVGPGRLAVELDVLRDPEARDEHELLVDHPEAGRHGRGGRVEGDRLPLEHDLAAVAAGLADHRHAEQHVHERALAGAVLAHQRVDRARPHREGHALEDPVAFVLLGDVAELEDRRGHADREAGGRRAEASRSRDSGPPATGGSRGRTCASAPGRRPRARGSSGPWSSRGNRPCGPRRPPAGR